MPGTRDLAGFTGRYVTVQGIGCAHQAFNGANDGGADWFPGQTSVMKRKAPTRGIAGRSPGKRIGRHECGIDGSVDAVVLTR